MTSLDTLNQENDQLEGELADLLATLQEQLITLNNKNMMLM